MPRDKLKLKEYNATYRAKHRKEIKIRMAAYNLSHKKEIAAYCASHREMINEAQRRRKRHERYLGVPIKHPYYKERWTA